MYIVTFYSFKGGVGRSMALANVGYELAKAGRRVLLVDFDLEAPGLTTFNLQKPEPLPPGVVDYVHDYLTSNEAPSVSNYVYESEAFENGGKLMVMPAGVDINYSARFQVINWQELYSERHGFLLFEELKEQWRSLLAADYVLVDSRTGHTDIAGICTRQLPDAVCILFFPNEQNLAGLKRVVDDVRSESAGEKGSRTKQIALHFVVSNVPTLDDEDKILANRLEKFRYELRYKEVAAQIHHYDSLALLNQVVFSKERPNSYLAQEYSSLTRAIRRANEDDRETVLEDLQRLTQRSSNESKSPITHERLSRISELYQDDGEISFWLGVRSQASNDPKTALLLFNKAISHDYTSKDVYLSRGSLLKSQGDYAAAIEDFSRVLHAGDPTTNVIDIARAVLELLELDASLAPTVAQSPAIRKLDSAEALLLAMQVEDTRPGMIVAKRLLSTIAVSDIHFREAARGQLGLILVGMGCFAEALQTINPLGTPPAQLDQVAAFNCAMATWGLTGAVSHELFQRVAELDEKHKRDEGNYYQCLAVTFWALGDLASARERLSVARRVNKERPLREFSCWRYMKTDPVEFGHDLDEIERLLAGEDVKPIFITHGRSDECGDDLAPQNLH